MRSKKRQHPAVQLKLVVAIALLCALGAAGYFLIQHKRPPSSSPNRPAVTQKASHDKTYCESETNGCFKYPADWAKPTRSETGYSALVEFGDTRDTLSDQYLFVPDSTATNSTFYTFSSRQLTVAGRTVDLIGGYFTGGLATHGGKPTSPAYYLVDASQAQQYDLTPGTSKPTTTSIGVNLASGWIVRFACSAGTQASTSGAAWFKTSDAQTCATILESLYFK